MCVCKNIFKLYFLTFLHSENQYACLIFFKAATLYSSALSKAEDLHSDSEIFSLFMVARMHEQSQMNITDPIKSCYE